LNTVAVAPCAPAHTAFALSYKAVETALQCFQLAGLCAHFIQVPLCYIADLATILIAADRQTDEHAYLLDRKAEVPTTADEREPLEVAAVVDALPCRASSRWGNSPISS